jgi:hypothetical protein
VVLVFRCFLGSATSSYVDDIAFIKILCEQDLMWHPQLQGRGVCFLFFLKVVLTFCCF